MSSDDTNRPQMPINLPSAAEQQRPLMEKQSAFELLMLEEKERRAEIELEMQKVEALKDKCYAYVDSFNNRHREAERMCQETTLRRRNLIRKLDHIANWMKNPEKIRRLRNKLYCIDRILSDSEGKFGVIEQIHKKDLK